MTLTISKTFELLVETVDSKTAQYLVDQCRALGMTEQEYANLGTEQSLPDFNKGYMFLFNTDNDETARMEILEKEGKILQAGIQIIYKPKLFFSNLNRHYKKTIDLFNNHYGAGLPMDLGDKMEIMNYGDFKTVSYVSKMKVNSRDVLTLRVGNSKFWNRG